MSVLGRKFFGRPAAVVAPELLGAKLCWKSGTGQVLASPITETEAYVGIEDRACHASKGRTPRTEVMFGPAGVWYVYLCYGVHWLLNIVTGDPQSKTAEAVLIRGVVAATGPGRVGKLLGLHKDWNGLRATRAAGLWVEEGEPVKASSIEVSPRIGVASAGEPWAHAELRYVWKERWKKP